MFEEPEEACGIFLGLIAWIVVTKTQALPWRTSYSTSGGGCTDIGSYIQVTVLLPLKLLCAFLGMILSVTPDGAPEWCLG